MENFPKENYYNLISNNGIIDILKYVKISYTLKRLIIENLLKDFNKEKINYALNIYFSHYVSLGKFNFLFIEKTLRGIIGRRIK